MGERSRELRGAAASAAAALARVEARAVDEPRDGLERRLRADGEHDSSAQHAASLALRLRYRVPYRYRAEQRYGGGAPVRVGDERGRAAAEAEVSKVRQALARLKHRMAVVVFEAWHDDVVQSKRQRRLSMATAAGAMAAMADSEAQAAEAAAAAEASKAAAAAERAQAAAAHRRLGGAISGAAEEDH